MNSFYIIAENCRAAAILAIQVWKHSKGVSPGMAYLLKNEAIDAYENQPVPMRKKYFPFKVYVDKSGFVADVIRFKK